MLNKERENADAKHRQHIFNREATIKTLGEVRDAVVR